MKLLCTFFPYFKEVLLDPLKYVYDLVFLITLVFYLSSLELTISGKISVRKISC